MGKAMRSVPSSLSSQVLASANPAAATAAAAARFASGPASTETHTRQHSAAGPSLPLYMATGFEHQTCTAAPAGRCRIMLTHRKQMTKRQESASSRIWVRCGAMRELEFVGRPDPGPPAAWRACATAPGTAAAPPPPPPPGPSPRTWKPAQATATGCPHGIGPLLRRCSPVTLFTGG